MYEFIKSPSFPPFNLGYHVGQVVELKDKKLVKSLLDGGIIIPADEPKQSPPENLYAKMKVDDLRKKLKELGVDYKEMAKADMVNYLTANVK